MEKFNGKNVLFGKENEKYLMNVTVFSNGDKYFYDEEMTKEVPSEELEMYFLKNILTVNNNGEISRPASLKDGVLGFGGSGDGGYDVVFNFDGGVKTANLVIEAGTSSKMKEKFLNGEMPKVLFRNVEMYGDSPMVTVSEPTSIYTFNYEDYTLRFIFENYIYLLIVSSDDTFTLQKTTDALPNTWATV